jgi:hypothetical protein
MGREMRKPPSSQVEEGGFPMSMFFASNNRVMANPIKRLSHRRLKEHASVRPSAQDFLLILLFGGYLVPEGIPFHVAAHRQRVRSHAVP